MERASPRTSTSTSSSTAQVVAQLDREQPHRHPSSPSRSSGVTAGDPPDQRRRGGAQGPRGASDPRFRSTHIRSRPHGVGVLGGHRRRHHGPERRSAMRPRRTAWAWPRCRTTTRTRPSRTPTTGPPPGTAARSSAPRRDAACRRRSCSTSPTWRPPTAAHHVLLRPDATVHGSGQAARQVLRDLGGGAARGGGRRAPAATATRRSPRRRSPRP